MSRYTPPKIEVVGLKKYLDDTKNDHNNNGYDQFIELIKARKELKVTVQTMAEKFNVDRTTMYRWLDVYHRELDNEN